MKVVGRIFYGIAVFIIICCGVVLVCAMSPSITKSIASALHGTEASEDGDADEGVNEDGMIVSGTNSGNGQDTSEYVVPSLDVVQLPELVSGKNGLEPVKGSEEQIPEAEASELKASLEIGNTGEEFSFDSEMYPYYEMLGEDLKQLYHQIYANALEQVGTFAPIVSVSTDKVKKVFEAVYNDHPELFWVETEYSCKYTSDGTCMQITLKYNSTVSNLAREKEYFEMRANAILQEANKLSDIGAKEKYVHDALVANVEYATGADMGQSAYSALVNGRSVCAGYARTFQYLLQQMGIPCYYCTGYSGEDHAWNIVKIDDAYYNVDVTWDDTEPSTYDYFNKTDAEYEDTHVRRDLSIYLPACKGNSGSVSDDGTVQGGDILGEEADAQENIQYINPNPQEPLTLDNSFMGSTKEMEEYENLKKAGITKEEVMDDMEEYYADCLEQIVEVGAGQQYFTNIIPASLWPTVEQEYGEGDHEKEYVEPALKKLGKEHFSIQIQMDDIGGGYYRLYHNIYIW